MMVCWIGYGGIERSVRKRHEKVNGQSMEHEDTAQDDQDTYHKNSFHQPENCSVDLDIGYHTVWPRLPKTILVGAMKAGTGKIISHNINQFNRGDLYEFLQGLITFQPYSHR